MPKAPVLSRELFYTKQRGGTFRLLDFCLVNTSLGAMVEPRPMGMYFVNKHVDIDPYDLEDFSSIREMNENEFYALTGTGGLQVTRAYNTL